MTDNILYIHTVNVAPPPRAGYFQWRNKAAEFIGNKLTQRQQLGRGIL